MLDTVNIKKWNWTVLVAQCDTSKIFYQEDIAVLLGTESLNSAAILLNMLSSVPDWTSQPENQQNKHFNHSSSWLWLLFQVMGFRGLFYLIYDYS